MEVKNFLLVVLCAATVILFCLYKRAINGWRKEVRLKTVTPLKFATEIENPTQIPSKIHRIVGRLSETNPLRIENMKSLEKRSVGCEHTIYENSGRDAVEKLAPHALLQLYDSIDPNYYAARSDFARYIILYYIGGLYLDDKSDILVDFKEFISNDRNGTGLICWRWKTSPHTDYIEKGEICQWGFACSPKHVILQKVIVYMCIRAYFDQGGTGGHFGVLKTTGPLMWSEVVKQAEDSGSLEILVDDSIGACYLKSKKLRKQSFSHYGFYDGPIFRQELMPNFEEVLEALSKLP